MGDFHRFRPDMSNLLDNTTAKRLADPPGFSPSVAKETVSM